MCAVGKYVGTLYILYSIYSIVVVVILFAFTYHIYIFNKVYHYNQTLHMKHNLKEYIGGSNSNCNFKSLTESQSFHFDYLLILLIEDQNQGIKGQH